ncbi:MAG: CAP domain-containing protein, partial [Lachnospiraceae bacterium]|nr:CAP domain-containing protein [Lachnospiraceae bacterium]
MINKLKETLDKNKSVLVGIIASFAVIAALAVGISKCSESAANRSLAEMDLLLLDEINEIRGEKGLKPLEMNETLKAYAATRSREISEKWSHTRPDGTQGADMITKDKWRGENLAFVDFPNFGYTDMEKEFAIETEMDDLKSSK